MTNQPKGSRLFPLEVCLFIHDHNVGKLAAELADLVNKTFGTSYTVIQIKNYRQRNHLNSGLTGRFEKGNVPFNKGKKTGNRPCMMRTQFKKGHTPHNHRTIGSERVNVDGYRERKVAEPNKWKLVHTIVWEASRGPVPDGHCIIFKDGDRLNCEIDNLLLVSRGEEAVMNKRQLRTPDAQLTETGHNVAQLILAISQAKKKSKKHKKEGEA